MTDSIKRKKQAESRILALRHKYGDLPEPEQTYAVEMDMAQELERLNEELTEVRWAGTE